MTMILIPVEDGEPILLDKAITFFGRHPDCDVVLINSRKVSRKHCCIAQIDNDYVVRDLGSMNGVRVNGDAIKKESRINAGDEVWVGDVGYRLGVATSEQVKAACSVAKSDAPDPRVRRVSPDMLSKDVPVAIPEEGADFVVEETRRNVQAPTAKKPKQPRHDESDEIIVLGDDDIIG